MLRILIVSILFSLVKPFKLSDYYNSNKKAIDIYPCQYISEKLWDTANDAVSAVNDLDYFKIVLHRKHHLSDKVNTICETDDRSATVFYTEYYPPRIDIVINNNLQYSTNSLYNVILHELGHTVGLAHSDTYGMMNYSVSLTGQDNLFIDDDRKLWLSNDDINGIANSYRDVKKKYCSRSNIFRNFVRFYQCLDSPWNV